MHAETADLTVLGGERLVQLNAMKRWSRPQPDSLGEAFLPWHRLSGTAGTPEETEAKDGASRSCAGYGQAFGNCGVSVWS